MTKTQKPYKLAHEILGLIAISALAALLLFLILSGTTTALVEEYVFFNDVPMTEFDWINIDRLVLGGSVILSLGLFTVLFLALLADRLAYIRKITQGIEALRRGEGEQPIPAEGNNELTSLAEAVNFLSAHQKQVKEKEQALQREKEELIRSLSHDIRTPLTSVLTYSEYLVDRETGLSSEGRQQLELIRKKSLQIRDLTDILLDGGKRNLEHFDDARLLFAQLVEEFTEELENSFELHTDLTNCAAFSGSFDVQELRRLFDNLTSNVRKYADPQKQVLLKITLLDGSIVIHQTNYVRVDAEKVGGFGIGISSIRRIAGHYRGSVSVSEDGNSFAVTATLSDF